jgi:hypothetical protein
MLIEIETTDNSVIETLLETSEYGIGSKIITPGNAELRYAGKLSKRGILPGANEVVEFTLTFASGVISSLVANWLYSKLKSKNVKIVRFERRQIELNKKSIQKLIEESIKIEG